MSNEDTVNSPTEPLKESGSQQLAPLKEEKVSVYSVASELETLLKRLINQVEDSDKEINEKLEAVNRRISRLEHSVVTESSGASKGNS